MFRTPFAWENQVRRELLDEEITRLRELPYSLWRDLVGRAMRKPVRGRDNKAYQLRTSIDWAKPSSSNIQITVTVESSGLRRKLLNQTFVITPDNEFPR